MDKLKKLWKNVVDESKELQRDLKKSVSNQPQAFQGAARTLASNPQPSQGHTPSTLSATSPPPRKPPNQASSVAAQAALARLEAKNKPLAPRTAPPRAPPDPVETPPKPTTSTPAAPDLETVLATVNDPRLVLSVRQLASHSAFVSSGPVLLKVLANIINNPADPKYRRLRMNNAKVQAALVDTDGALEIMQHVGFVLEFDAVEGQEEGYLIFPEHAELEGLQRAVDVLSTLLPGHMPKPPPKPVPGFTGRNTKVLLPVETHATVPDWFFEYTSAELKAQYTAAVRAREQSTQLLTSAMREKLSGLKTDPTKYTHAMIRVRLPEGLVLQGDFGAGESTADVYAWVTDALRRPELGYDLMLPTRTRLQGGAETVRHADLMPSTLLNFRWSEEHRQAMARQPTLKEGLMETAVPATDAL